MTFLLFISFVSLTIFWLISLAVIIFKKKPIEINTENLELGISIVIAAKNEYVNLKNHLDYWLDLDYTNYQVIIVINNTNDESYKFLQNIKNHKLKVINLESTPIEWSPKKFALTKGILNADYEYIVLTDADCKPLSNQWLKYYNTSFQNGNQIVLGLSPYASKKMWFNCLIEWETFFTAYLYSFTALLQSPYMCVGRNWGFKKDIFFQEKGYEKHKNVLSGDDDLFIQNLEKKYKFDVLFSPASQTISNPKTQFIDYLKQKKRHYSASKYYKLTTKFLLFTLNFMQFISLFWIFNTINILENKILLLSLCLMNFVKFTSMQIFTHKTGFRIPMIFKFFGEYIFLMFQIIVLPFSFSKSKQWK